jgi:hypothetical protein
VDFLSLRDAETLDVTFGAIMQVDCKGEDLSTYSLQNSPLDIFNITTIATQLVEGLQEIHAHSIIHKVRLMLTTFHKIVGHKTGECCN